MLRKGRAALEIVKTRQGSVNSLVSTPMDLREMTVTACTQSTHKIKQLVPHQSGRLSTEDGARQLPPAEKLAEAAFVVFPHFYLGSYNIAR